MLVQINKIDTFYISIKTFLIFGSAYHGNIGSLLELSPSKWKNLNITKKEWVHVVSRENGVYKNTKQIFVPLGGLRVYYILYVKGSLYFSSNSMGEGLGKMDIQYPLLDIKVV